MDGHARKRKSLSAIRTDRTHNWQTLIELTLPTADELEVSVFGRGFGEAMVLHLGNGEWACVDSCLEPRSAEPAAMAYLSALNLAPRDVVKLVGITHWDDDHMRGVGRIVEDCPNATIACSAALRQPDILEFVISTDSAGSGLGSGVDELRTVLRLRRDRGQPLVWAKANLPLHPRPHQGSPTVTALSPSEDDVQRSIESLIKAATGKDIVVQGRYRAPETANGASVAMSVTALGLSVLLGADLETSKNPESGWQAVLTYAAPQPASLLKVPHHGSIDAHHDGMWSVLTERDPVAILTSWQAGNRFLPTTRDLQRLKSLSQNLYLAASPRVRQVDLDSEARAMVRRLHGQRIDELLGWGHVRARRKQGESTWMVGLAGDAVRVA